ncbi:unnamed protein product [Rotaria sordida]|uniref:PLAT domain-containing protein n=1 Tax=Rotaria sordida TaxID=392033 RepID=A0A813SNH3_9BILA|nr:unnamed protein product [Rotaria sordida]CAF3706954.1 unnamed protein product [Rotaria sordida]
MNGTQSIIKNYLLILKTLHGDPGENITVIIKGNSGQTEKISLGKSQSYHKAFKHNQTDLFLLLSNIDVSKIFQVEFCANTNSKFKQWRFNNIFIIDGTHIYRGVTSEHSLLLSTDISTMVNVTEPLIGSQESFYCAFIKTGNDSCSKGCYPTLSLFGNNQQHTDINMKSSYRMHSSSTNNNIALEKYQFDIFQWQDYNIGNIERIRLQLYSENKESKCQWPIEWMFIIHNGYSFTGRIVLNRIIKTDRFIDIGLEQKILSIPNEYGDSSRCQKKYDDNIFLSNILNKQSNAISDDIGRYYVIIRNIDGTNGNVYINFHGDLLSSSGEQHLIKCENYPDHPFDSKHTDLYHIKASEVGHIHSVSVRLDQTNKDHSLTLDCLYVIHNAIVHEFDVKYNILNKEQPKKKYISLTHPPLPIGKVCYYIATHTTDKILSRTNANFKVVVTGTKGIFGPMEFRESLTNGNNPFEKECIDLFHIEDDDIGDPISVTITLEPNGKIMVIKNGEYNSLWQLVGDLKSKESKTISLPIQQQKSTKNQIISVEDLHLKNVDEITPLYTIEQINSLETKTQQHIETKPIINNIQTSLLSDYHHDNLILTEIEDHQKRHIFASSLYQAQQNYRELRRLLRKMNGSIQKEKKTRVSQKQLIDSTRQKTNRIS